jgi:zinc protease
MTKQDFSTQKINSFPGPDDITRIQLKNGITFLFRPNMNSMVVSIGGYIQAGSIYDPEDKLGLADFTTSTLMRGTKTQSFQEIFDSLESIGASLGIGCGPHTAGFGGKALAEDLPTLLKMLADVLMNPVFPKKDIERVRSQLLTGLDLRAQDTNSMAMLEFEKVLYKDHPYQNPSDGYIETIQAIKVQDLTDFHQKHFGPKDMTLVVVGPFEPESVISLAEEQLGSWFNENQVEVMQVPDMPSPEKSVNKHHVIDEKIQTDLVVGTIGPSRDWEGYYSALLGNSVLGQFGMMGRIGESVRNEAGLAYYAYSSLSASIGPGQWMVSAGVAPENRDKALDLIKTELKKFVDQPISAEELRDVQSNYIGKLPLSLESNAGVASALLTLEQHQLGLDYLRNYENMIQKITPETILAAAREFLDPERLIISSAGPEL